MNPRVTAVRPRSGHCLELTFSDGRTGVYDCRPLLHVGVFRELNDMAYFRQARVEGGTVAWPHEQDICPDTLYEEARFPVPLSARSRTRRPRRGCAR
jgi:hypothetical protein